MPADVWVIISTMRLLNRSAITPATGSQQQDRPELQAAW